MGNPLQRQGDIIYLDEDSRNSVRKQKENCSKPSFKKKNVLDNSIGMDHPKIQSL